ncbi:MAG: DNA internalization-related competence protein ComEC/Rec2 [Pseudomonadota bacterium]
MRAPLFWLSWPLLLGVLLALRLPGPALPALVGAAGCALLAGRRAGTGWLALGAAALLIGWVAPALVPTGPTFTGSASLRGQVLPLGGPGGQMVDLEAWAPTGQGWSTVHGRVSVVFGDDAPRPGQRVVLWGRARLLERDLLPGAPDLTLTARLAGARVGFKALRWQPLGGTPAPRPEPPPCRHRGLLRALALGDREEVPEEIDTLLGHTGTRHLLAISGLHLGLVGGLAGWLVSRLARLRGLCTARSRPWLLAAPAMVAAALAYGGLAGWPASAWRAGAMLAAAGFGLALERTPDGRQLLGAAVWATVLLEPALVATAGWQLSAGALLGLLLVTPRLARLLPPDLSPPLAWLARGAASTIAATLGTLPAAAWWFQELAPTSVLANLVAIPLVGLVATPCALLATLLPGWPARAAAAVACWDLDLCLGWLRLVQAPCWHPAVGPWGALALLALPLLARRPAVASLAALIALGLRGWPRGHLVLTFLAVGQGDAALVTWPDGRRWLVDGGPEERAVLRWLRREGVRHLDVVVATHPHPDHMAGLPAVLEELEVDELWVPRLARPEEADYRALLALARASGAEVRLPGDSRVPALYPPPGWQGTPGALNDDSLVLALASGQHRVLLTGDVEAQAEADIAGQTGPVDVLKVPHHGSRTSSSPALLAALRPRLAVISCGAGNSFGHPHPEVLARYAGARLLRTDLHGTIEIEGDGLSLTLRAWSPGQGWRDLGALAPYSAPSLASSSASFLSDPSLESSRKR